KTASVPVHAPRATLRGTSGENSAALTLPHSESQPAIRPEKMLRSSSRQVWGIRFGEVLCCLPAVFESESSTTQFLQKQNRALTSVPVCAREKWPSWQTYRIRPSRKVFRLSFRFGSPTASSPLQKRSMPPRPIAIGVALRTIRKRSQLAESTSQSCSGSGRQYPSAIQPLYPK